MFISHVRILRNGRFANVTDVFISKKCAFGIETIPIINFEISIFRRTSLEIEKEDIKSKTI